MILIFHVTTDQVDHFSEAIPRAGARIISATPGVVEGDVRLEVSATGPGTAQTVLNLYFGTSPHRTLPEQMTPPIEDVLCRMLMETTPIAHLFRETGEQIPNKVEREQAFVLFWMLGLALEHGAGWRLKAAEELNPRIERAKAQRSAAAFPENLGGRPMLTSEESQVLRQIASVSHAIDHDTHPLRALVATRLVERFAHEDGAAVRITGNGRIWLDTQPKQQPVPA